MENILNSLFQLFTNGFSFKRLLGLIVLVSLLIIGILLFERYTSSFGLARLQKSAELLILVSKLDKEQASFSEDLKVTHTEFKKQVNQAIAKKPFSLRFSFPDISWISFLKFILAFWPWLIFALPTFNEHKNSRIGTSAIIIIMGSLAGLLGVFLPNNLLINLLLYPLGFLIFMAIIIAIFGLIIAKKHKAKKSDDDLESVEK